jgi:hypothetical protein
VNFTREPIIETIITPKEGFRLVVRGSKQNSNEEFSVEAVEVVSFGLALFFRSLEKPRQFIVPVGDYEVVEVKESRVALKNVQYEKTIKIGGGKEAVFRKEQDEDKEDEALLPPFFEEETKAEVSSVQEEKKQRERHRRRRRRSQEEQEDNSKVEVSSFSKEGVATGPLEASVGENRNFHVGKKILPLEKLEQKKDGFGGAISLIPPPTKLISDTIHRYKEQQSGITEDENKPLKREGVELESLAEDSFFPTNINLFDD